MIDDVLDRYAKILGRHRPDVSRLLQAAALSDDAGRIAKTVLRAKLRRAGIRPEDDDPFTAILSAEQLGGHGVNVGPLAHGGGELVWRHEEIPYSALFVGSPGGGKTGEVLHLLIQL